MDEMNYDFQALALESRGMGEVRTVFVCISFTLLTLVQFSVIIILFFPRATELKSDCTHL